ncbi:hypothetical protein [Nannocystis pusilla]|uniref:hypothetical protein n=1 Tax=Nannocystis pusilla TaxID=889268 RepID=UPI003DA3FC3B
MLEDPRRERRRAAGEAALEHGRVRAAARRVPTADHPLAAAGEHDLFVRSATPGDHLDPPGQRWSAGDQRRQPRRHVARLLVGEVVAGVPVDDDDSCGRGRLRERVGQPVGLARVVWIEEGARDQHDLLAGGVQPPADLPDRVEMPLGRAEHRARRDAAVEPGRQLVGRARDLLAETVHAVADGRERPEGRGLDRDALHLGGEALHRARQQPHDPRADGPRLAEQSRRVRRQHGLQLRKLGRQQADLGADEHEQDVLALADRQRRAEEGPIARQFEVLDRAELPQQVAEVGLAGVEQRLRVVLPRELMISPPTEVPVELRGGLTRQHRPRQPLGPPFTRHDLGVEQRSREADAAVPAEGRRELRIDRDVISRPHGHRPAQIDQRVKQSPRHQRIGAHRPRRCLDQLGEAAAQEQPLDPRQRPHGGGVRSWDTDLRVHQGAL